jgi:general nucleoside transport system permease protein
MGLGQSKGGGVMDSLLITGLLAATIRLGMAIGLASIGEAASERSGIFNIGIEGIMLSAAFVAAWGSVHTGSPWLGVLFAVIIGVLLAGFHALMVLVLGVDQFVSGIGMVIFGFGFSSFAARLTIGAQPTAVPGLASLDLGAISHLPIVGPIVFAQSPLAYLALALAIATGWVLKRTALGLEIRACGESAEIAKTLAIPVRARQTACILFGGVTAGLGGAYLSVVQVNAFVEGMVAGRGFLAVACVMLGRRRPLAAFAAALGFGLAEATQIRLQTLYPDLPYQFLAMLPYVAAIAALVIGHARRRERLA